MSYCRFGSGDAYMFACGDGGITCCACHIVPLRFSVHYGTGRNTLLDTLKKMGKPSRMALRKCPFLRQAKLKKKPIGGLVSVDPIFDRAEDALAHLQRHMAQGDHIPDYAIDRLKEEIRQGENPGRRPFWKIHGLRQLLRLKKKQRKQVGRHRG